MWEFPQEVASVLIMGIRNGRVSGRRELIAVSIYTLSDLGVLSNLIGSLSLANEHYSPPIE